MASHLPDHLRKYIVEQDYEKYTPIDQAVWRYILRQLRHYLGKHAHECYLEGLQKTGIEVERIPQISKISEKLQKFGWRALPVSGFIPPAAFMELQSLGVLPVASDLRSIDHLHYTPAPDIVHEAAGHAPILIHPEFAEYLRRYAQVAKKAIISQEDLDVYEAIRELSDIKENPTSTPQFIAESEKKLAEVTAKISHVSEAAQLGRMNWWTAEYGLIGDLSSPKIFGAGLLSSVGESRWCLSEKVKKIPLSVDCVEQTYDITEPQPQLFVTPDFKTLGKVLDQFSESMAFRQGGFEGLTKILWAQSINSIELSSGLQVSGTLTEIITSLDTFHKDHLPPLPNSKALKSSSQKQEVVYLRFSGPSQLCFEDKELEGHGKDYHSQGFGTPVGRLKKFPQLCPSQLTDEQWKEIQLEIGKPVSLDFSSGVHVKGIYQGRKVLKGKTLLLTFKEATVSFKERILFDPSWGVFDLALGDSIPSVFGGPADRGSFGETKDFVVKKVHLPQWNSQQLELQRLYKEVRFLRENQIEGEALLQGLQKILKSLKEKFPLEWLLRLEVFEILSAQENSLSSALTATLKEEISLQLKEIRGQKKEWATVIDDGLALAHQ